MNANAVLRITAAREANQATFNDLTAALPPELTTLRAFLFWRYGPPKPGKKPPKVPYYADGGKRCGTQGAPEDLARLGALGDAESAAMLDGADGVGLALAGCAGVATLLDFDKCREDGALLDNEAGRIAQRCIDAGCYWEPSPSGTGVHVIAAFAAVGDFKRNDIGVEAFERVGFVTLTGECPPELRGRPLQPLPDGVVAELRRVRDSGGIGPDGTPLGKVTPWGTRDAIAARAARAAAGGPHMPRSGEGATAPLPPRVAALRAALAAFDPADRATWVWVAAHCVALQREPGFALPGNLEARNAFVEWAMLPEGHASYASEAEQWAKLEEFDRKTRCDPFDLFRRAEAFGVPRELIAVPAELVGFEPLPDDDPGGPAEPWPAPQPLTATVDPQPYPLDALPPRIRAAVEEVQAFVQAPVPLVVGSALSALAVAAQGLADVQRAEKLQGPCSLFFLSIADSGERKSTLDGFFMAPVHEYERAMAAFVEPDRERYHADVKVWEHRRQGLLDAIRQKAKKGNPTVDEEQRLRATVAERPEAPKQPQLLLGDVTPEALAYRLAKEWPSAAVVSAEAGVVFGGHAMGKDSVMRNLALLNTLWDGGRHLIDRRTSESFTVDGVRFSMALQVQEVTLRAFLEQAGELARGSGFLARFLIAWPTSTQGHRPFKAAPDRWPALQAFRGRLAALLNEPLMLDAAGRLTPPLLTPAPAAHAAWVEFHDGVEAELRQGGKLADVRDVASKAADNVARLAALFHLFEGAGGPLSEEALARAARVVGWHVHEARRFFGELALPPDLAAARRLDAWLLSECRRTGKPVVHTRDAQRRGPVRGRQRLDDALRELEELERVRVRTEGRARLVAINPVLLGAA